MADQTELARISDEYIRALGLQRSDPDLAFLNDIISRHVAQFAFSSIGPLLGEDLPLAFDALYQRIVVNKRGGYCFEQNGLLYDVLKELGFSVTLYLARVIYNEDIHPGLTHRISMIEINAEQYVVDVGFGPLGPALSVAMSGRESHDNYRTFRIAEPHPGEFHMQTFRDGAFYSLYKFELARYGQADCEVGHFYSHRHPKASFVNNLVISRILNNEVRSLRNREYKVISASGVKKIPVNDETQLKKILETQFNLDVTEAENRQLFKKSLTHEKPFTL